jgi:hypothetical protein
VPKKASDLSDPVSSCRLSFNSLNSSEVAKISMAYNPNAVTTAISE